MGNVRSDIPPFQETLPVSWRGASPPANAKAVTGGKGRGVLRRLASAAALCSVLSSAAAFGAQAHEALQRAAVLAQEGRLQEAAQQAQQALSDPETRAAACSVLGAIRLQEDRLAEGAQLLQEAIRLEPRLLGAHLSLAQVYTLQGKLDDAVPLFRRVLELDPKNPTARMALARSEAEKGHYERSLELARPALAAFKQSPEGLLILATDFLKTGIGPPPPRWPRTRGASSTSLPPGSPASRNCSSGAVSSRRASTSSSVPERPTLRHTSCSSPSAVRIS